METTNNNSVDDLRKDLITSFHNQFAENQNHYQQLFIKFISSVFIVLVGYAYAFINLKSNASFTESIINSSGQLLSYGIIHYFFAYALAQTILCLMAMLILQIGYSFRRDQMVNFNVRNKVFGESDYINFFGLKAFNPLKLNFWTFLPGFNYTFFIFILAIQLIVLVSLMYMINILTNLPKEINIIVWYSIATFPFLLTAFHYWFYYLKYNSKIKNPVIHYKYYINNDNEIAKKEVATNMKTILGVFTVGKTLHYITSKKCKLQFDYDVNNRTVHLVYLFASRKLKDSHMKILRLVNELEKFMIENEVKESYAIVINRKLLDKENVLTRFGWNFKQKKFLAKKYYKKVA